MPVRPHNHDYHEGPFCNQCGQPYEPLGKSTGNGRTFLFRPLNYNWSIGSFLLLAALCVGLSTDVGVSRGRNAVPAELMAGLLVLSSIFAFCYRNWVAVDLQDQRIHTFRGIGPFKARDTYKVSDIQSISTATRLVSTRYGYRRYHDLYLNLTSGSLRVASSENWGSHWEDGRALALAINRPFISDDANQTGWLGTF